MDTINKIVAINTKRIREQNKLSLDELAKISGVSKSMLAQIERGEGNPSITTLWKISTGMKVPFDALTCREAHQFEIVKHKEIDPVLDDFGKVRNYPIFPDDGNRKFAIYTVDVESGAYWSSEPHLKGTVEFITVFSGVLTIRYGEEECVINANESVRFMGDVKHSYHNSSCDTVKLINVIFTP